MDEPALEAAALYSWFGYRPTDQYSLKSNPVCVN
jgi:hypothetical protein